MVPYIARQSVIIKCNMQKSVLLGNYEFYYAAGLFQKFYGAGLSADMKPEELAAAIAGFASSVKPADEQETYLLSLLANYEPDDEQNEQTALLFSMGEGEKTPWKV